MNIFYPRLVVALALILAGAESARAQLLTIRTLAGGAEAGASDGFGSNARFNHPDAVTADNAGNIYVADTENGTIRKITTSGYVSTLAGQAGSYGSADGTGSAARFYGPQGIAADGAGQLYVADTANHTIRLVTPAGLVTTIAGVPGVFNSFDGVGTNAQFYHPEGVALDAGGNLYVADTWNHTIRKITPDAVVSTVAGLAGSFGAADGTNSKARFYRPTGIAVDGATNLYVADSFNHTLRLITPAGQVTTIAGLAGIWGSTDGSNNTARFYLPQGIVLAASGDLFVTDSGNQSLRKISLVGTNWVVSTVAGSTGLAGNENGSGSSGQFYFPAGLGTDNTGQLYLADTANHLIRTTRAVPPTLQFTRQGNQIVLFWPVSAEGFALEQTAALGPFAAWSLVTDNIVSNEDNFIRTSTMVTNTYYRLRFQ